jgi:hypothetical protein
MKHNLMKRVKKKTPQWFRYVRNAGLALSTFSTGIICHTEQFSSPVVNIACYCAVAGMVMAAVAQTAVENE